MRWLMKCLAVAGFAAMNIMLLSVSVWSGNVSDMTPGDARLLPLAVGADRAAGRGLCRPAVLPERVCARSARAALNMDVPISLGVIAGARHVAGRDRDHARARLFRFRDHAAVLPAVRALARPCDAAQDPRGRRQSRRAQGRRRAPLRRTAKSCSVPAAALQAGRPAAGAARRARSRRRRRDHRHVRDRRKPGHRRDSAARRRGRRHGLCRQREFLRHADHAGDRRRRRHADRRGRAAARAGRRRRSRATCGSPTAPRGSTRRSSTPPPR